ncbi:hypothetical protein ABNG03_16440 [Halorubrum sp. RMP-47]|uniref:Uncharacterized protein n=1 Tax=Halorubrum miltondacostae TaxID=3076378 RepID=A0ABD5M0Z6_9EURY
MAEDRRDAPTDRLDALDEQAESSAARPIATRTRVPESPADPDAEAPDEPTGDRTAPVDDDPIYPRTRVP